MADTQTSQRPGDMSGQVMFYSRPEPLSFEAHGKLGVNPTGSAYAFAAAATIVPLQVGEFGPAALSYPIIFAGDWKTPMAVLGVRPGESLFVDKEGRWDDQSYVPGFVRRYPFVLAGDEGQEQLVVCIDRDAAMIAEGGQIPLFQGNQLSTYGQNAVEFCSNFENDRRRSETFVARLKELDLFEAKAAAFTPRMPDGSQGQPIQLADYFAISEQKLADLPDAVLRELHANNALRQIHAHMISMHNWERLVARASMRGPLPTA